MCKKFALFFCAFFLSAALPCETQYTITALELTELEGISESWARNKQNLQSQVQNLKTELSEAHKLSESLNAQLKAERETSSALRKSFNAYAREAAQLQLELSREKLLREKIKHQRNVLLSTLVFVALAAAAAVAVKVWARINKLLL